VNLLISHHQTFSLSDCPVEESYSDFKIIPVLMCRYSLRVVLFSIYEIGVTSIKLDIHSALEEKDGHVLHHIRHNAYQFYLFISIFIYLYFYFYWYFISYSIIVKNPSIFHSLSILYIMCFNNVMMYVFFWVIPRHLNYICQCYGTHCSIVIGV